MGARTLANSGKYKSAAKIDTPMEEAAGWVEEREQIKVPGRSATATLT